MSARIAMLGCIYKASQRKSKIEKLLPLTSDSPCFFDPKSEEYMHIYYMHTQGLWFRHCIALHLGTSRGGFVTFKQGIIAYH